MARRLFIFDDPDRFVAGTVGEPGNRSFYLQARQGGALVSLALEKLQVAALAERLEDLLESVDPDAPAALVGGPQDDRPLDEPLIELFRVGPMALAWDGDAGSVVIEAQPVSADGDYLEASDDDPDGPDLLRVRLSVAAARDFVRRATAVVEAGRPACPFCGEPLDPQGHLCPRLKTQLN